MPRLLTPFVLLIALSACRALPDLSTREPSVYIATQSAPQLESLFNIPKRAAAPPNAYVFMLAHAHDAFIARAALVEHAQVSLDLQYYIWRNDVSGNLLLKQLWQAAERGVRVRLLLDDNNTSGNDALFSTLDSHPNIQVRLFNPFLYRKVRFVGYLTDFSRLNRRMHNKSFTADNRVSIIGGRNIGDEYLDSHADTAFADLDVLVAGNIVNQISSDFDRYWQSDSAYPIAQIARSPYIEPQLFHKPINAQQQRFLNTIAQEPLAQSLQRRQIKWIPAQSHLVSDDPAKALNQQKNPTHILEHIDYALHTPKEDIYLVSPYFVPTEKGTEVLRDFAKQGVDITVFTNSLHATDVAAVHSGYARYRKPLLQAGIKLYEFKPYQAVPKQRHDYGLTGSSSTSLHAKTFIIDKKRVFVGSLNLDPRSARLNTEMGLVIHHPELAKTMRQKLQQDTEATAYRVELNEQGKLQWHDPETGKTLRHEPEASIWKRMLNRILSILPIERLL